MLHYSDANFVPPQHQQRVITPFDVGGEGGDELAGLGNVLKVIASAIETGFEVCLEPGYYLFFVEYRQDLLQDVEEKQLLVDVLIGEDVFSVYLGEFFVQVGGRPDGGQGVVFLVERS